MGKTIAEKILSRASGKAGVKAGDYVTAKIDLHYTVHTGTAEVHEKLVAGGLADGLPAVADADKLAICVGDHETCHSRPQSAVGNKLCRELGKRYGIEKVFDIDSGIAHIFLPEQGLVRPGMLVCGKDSHTTTGGAVNALATPVGAIETAWIYLTGELWFLVPETVKMVCNGKLPEGVGAKDIFLFIIGKYTPSLAQYKSLEWKGPVIDAMSMDGRFTLACQSIELGAKCVPFEPDDTCLEYVAATPHGGEWQEPTPADPDAHYERVYTEDFSRLEPQVAMPHGFGVVQPVSAVAGTRIDQCNLGSCANARYEDLEIVARIVKGRKTRARVILSPGTWGVYQAAIRSGVMETLVDAGVMIVAPSCLPCGMGGCLADGEVAVAATTRNFKGRLGSPRADIYLASPATAAASALTGEITDPREFL